MIDFDFYCEPDGSLHFEKHKITIQEIDEAINEHNYLYSKRADGSYIAFSILDSGRYLQIVFRKISTKKYFIITAYDCQDQNIINQIEKELP